MSSCKTVLWMNSDGCSGFYSRHSRWSPLHHGSSSSRCYSLWCSSALFEFQPLPSAPAQKKSTPRTLASTSLSTFGEDPLTLPNSVLARRTNCLDIRIRSDRSASRVWGFGVATLRRREIQDPQWPANDTWGPVCSSTMEWKAWVLDSDK